MAYHHAIDSDENEQQTEKEKTTMNKTDNSTAAQRQRLALRSGLYFFWKCDGGSPMPRNRGDRQRGPQTNYLVETSAVKKRSIRLRHRAASTRIRSGIAFVSVCVLVGLVTFFAGAHAQVTTPIPAATATPAPTATPFPTFVPGRVPPHP
jgi:hypothetical protein